MDRRGQGAVRTGVTAVGVAAGLFVLASTAQTPDGFVYASFGGPLDVFGTSTADVLNIGDGSGDATELATLLKVPGTISGDTPDAPYRVAIQSGSTPSATTVNVFPTTDPTIDFPAAREAASLPSRPVVDAQGKVDCTGAVSCNTDPVTKVTTVTYPDGVVAIVQKVNDLTVVAYKALEKLPVVSSLLPPLPAESVAPTAPPVPAPPVDVPPTLPAAPPSPEVAAPVIDPGPPAPDAVKRDDVIQRGPKVNVTIPPLDFGPDTDLGVDLPKPNIPKPDVPGLGKVKDAIGSAVDAIKDAVGNAVNPGASHKPDSAGNSGGGNSDNGNSDKRGGNSGDGP